VGGGLFNARVSKTGTNLAAGVTPLSNSKIPIAVINPDALPESLEAKLPPVDNGTECYPKDAYFSSDAMTSEWA